MSSLPNWPLTKSASRAALEGSVTSSWWKKTSAAAALERLMASTASSPLASFLAVRTTLSPLVASCRHVSSPIPLFPPVTSAILNAPGAAKSTGGELARRPVAGTEAGREGDSTGVPLDRRRIRDGRVHASFAPIGAARA